MHHFIAYTAEVKRVRISLINNDDHLEPESGQFDRNIIKTLIGGEVII